MIIKLPPGRNENIFGVRPLSKQYFELYKKDVREEGSDTSPALFHLFNADMPQDLEASRIQKSDTSIYMTSIPS